MNDTDVTADAATLPEALRLSPVEARILGALIEKGATTPDQYPLTESALTLACNQKTSRDPVMDLSSGEVGHALRQLEPRQLVRSQHAARAQRWEHRFAHAYGITVPQQAVLCLLLLRGPQTLNEIFTRCERIGRFAGAEDARHALERLGQRTPALAILLPRAAGQREDRWAHLLCGPVSVEAIAPHAGAAGAGTPHALLERIEALEARVAALEAQRANPDHDAGA